MKEKIKSLLQGAWSSAIGGVDIDKATVLILDEIVRVLGVAEMRHDEELIVKEDLIESFEMDMELSNQLLVEVLPELESYVCTHSNNPNKYASIRQLIFRIEEQIIQNGK